MQGDGMTPALVLTLSGLLAAPAPADGPSPRLQITPTLSISAEFLEAGQRAPRPGYFLNRANMRLLLAEAATAGEACDARIRDQQTLCATQLAAAAADCSAKLAPLTARISDLQATESDLREVVQATERELGLWKAWSYIGGSALLSTIAYLAIIK